MDIRSEAGCFADSKASIRVLRATFPISAFTRSFGRLKLMKGGRPRVSLYGLRIFFCWVELEFSWFGLVRKSNSSATVAPLVSR